MTSDVLPRADDAIRESDARLAAPKLPQLECRGGLAANIEPTTIAFRCNEDAIIGRFDELGKVGVYLDYGAPALESSRAEILKPNLRALHTIEGAVRAIGEG